MKLFTEKETYTLFMNAAKVCKFKETTATRAYNALCRGGIITVNGFLKLTEETAKSMRGISTTGETWKCIERVQEVLRKKSYMMVFLSHKMNGLTEEEVYEIRNNALNYLTKKYGHNICVLDNYHHYDVPKGAGRIWHLGESIKMMERADAVYFCPGWEEAKGCKIEYEICKTYNLKILE